MTEINLSSLSIEDLTAEIKRRKGAEVSELRRKIEEHKSAIRELEARIQNHSGEKATRTRKASSGLSAGERAERVLTGLEGAGSINIADLADKVGFDGPSLKKTLDELVDEKKITREGKARGTKYRLA